MLLFYAWIFSSLCNVNALEPKPHTSSCTELPDHEESTLLQGWATPKSKPKPVILTDAVLPELGLLNNETTSANTTISQQVSAPSAPNGGVISIKLDSELQVSADQATRKAIPLSFLATAIDLVKASAADTSPHPTGTEATAVLSAAAAHAAASRNAEHSAGPPLALSDSSLPALIHKTALAQFFLCRALCLKYDPWRSDALLITLVLIFAALLCGGLVMCCLHEQRPGRMSNYMTSSPTFQGRSWGPSSSTSRSRLQQMRPQERTPSPVISTPVPMAGHTTFGSTMSSPPATGLQSRVNSASAVGGQTSLNADLVLPPDKEVLLAVPSLALTPQSDKPVEHPIANKDGAPILRVAMARKMEGASIREHLAIFLWEDGIQLAFCEIWPERLRMGASTGNLQDAVVGSIFRGTGELYANIIRHFPATGGSSLPVGEFLISSPAGVPWQHKMQSKGRDLMVVDMSGHAHGMVMSGVDLSFANYGVQYYQLHALAGTDVCLLLMTVMSIDRLTLLSKEGTG
mmetsp:Transcript_53658/g.98529  ORF Transcript_53658/g.98529 Transcript_53658/m.98529 type:complete len:518 (+) Transcript_53658:105-1658(+)